MEYTVAPPPSSFVLPLCPLSCARDHVVCVAKRARETVNNGNNAHTNAAALHYHKQLETKATVGDQDYECFRFLLLFF